MNLLIRINNLRRKLGFFFEDDSIDPEKWNKPHKDDLIFSGWDEKKPDKTKKKSEVKKKS